MWTSPSNTFRPKIPCLHHTLTLNKKKKENDKMTNSSEPLEVVYDED